MKKPIEIGEQFMFIPYQKRYNPRIDFQVVFFMNRYAHFGWDYAELKSIFNANAPSRSKQGAEFKRLLAAYNSLKRDGTSSALLNQLGHSFGIEKARGIDALLGKCPSKAEASAPVQAVWLFRETLLNNCFEDYSCEIASFLFDSTLARSNYVPVVFRRSDVELLRNRIQNSLSLDSLRGIFANMSDNSQCYLQSYGCTSKEAIVSAIVGAKMQMKKDYGVTAVWLFGSFATDEADEFSDVDLLISGSGRRRGESLGLIANAYRSLLHRPIDVHYEDGPWLGDRSSLKKERVLLYDDH